MTPYRRSLFVVVLGTALGFVACGRQVTPNPAGLGAGGTPPGYLAIFFTTQGALNFSNYKYIVVLNTSGSRVTPSTDTIQTNWAGYYFALVALGNGISTYAEPVYFVRSTQNPHVPPRWLTVLTPPQTFSYNINANGTNTEFSMLAQRVLFDYNPSPSPSPSPSASPTASPSNLWTFNAFVAQVQPSGTWAFYDSMGAGGPYDPQFVSPTLCMSEPFDNTYFPQGQFAAPDPSAEIVSIEIANNPASPKPC